MKIWWIFLPVSKSRDGGATVVRVVLRWLFWKTTETTFANHSPILANHWQNLVQPLSSQFATILQPFCNHFATFDNPAKPLQNPCKTLFLKSKSLRDLRQIRFIREIRGLSLTLWLFVSLAFFCRGNTFSLGVITFFLGVVGVHRNDGHVCTVTMDTCAP